MAYLDGQVRCFIPLQDIHFQLDFTCVDCHGGDPATDDFDEAKGEETGFIWIPKTADIPELCGKCYNDPSLMRRYNPNIKGTIRAQRPVDRIHWVRLYLSLSVN